MHLFKKHYMLSVPWLFSTLTGTLCSYRMQGRFHISKENDDNLDTDLRIELEIACGSNLIASRKLPQVFWELHYRYSTEVQLLVNEGHFVKTTSQNFVQNSRDHSLFNWRTTRAQLKSISYNLDSIYRVGHHRKM